MGEKLRGIFDNKLTWLGIGSLVGTFFGDKAALIVNGIGAVVMQVL